jgi:Mce-associated membrane protein
MSGQSPRSSGPRRRIAGERRPARADVPAPPTSPSPRELRRTARRDRSAEAAGPGSTEVPAPTVSKRRSRPVREGSGPSWLVVALVGVLALVLVALAVVLGTSVWSYGSVRHQDQVDESSRTAPSAAERAAATILSYDYKSLDADEKAAERYMAPAYAKKYAATFDKLVRPNAPKLRAHVVAKVKASGVSHADADRVDVLVYVNQTTTSTANSGTPQVALNRALFSMVRSHGGWLVTNITSY